MFVSGVCLAEGVGLRSPAARVHPLVGDLQAKPRSASPLGFLMSVLRMQAFSVRPQKNPTHDVRERGLSCGGGGIRTHDTDEGMPVFKTGAFSQALPPLRRR